MIGNDEKDDNNDNHDDYDDIAFDDHVVALWCRCCSYRLNEHDQHS